jgi:hypothetical protein
MSQLQKYAWFNLAVFGLAVVVYLSLVPIMGPIPAFCAFGVCGLWGFGPAIVRRNRPGKIVWDERENAIWLKSGRIAFATFWVVFVIAAMIPWFILGPKGTISVNALPGYVFLGMGTIWVTQSLAVIIQYRRGVSNDGE